MRDLGLELERMASTILILSHTMEDLGNQLKKDETLVNDPAKYQRARRNIQNNMGKDLILITMMLIIKIHLNHSKDAMRYAGPALSTVSKFVIPLARPAPRRLGIVRPRP